ncbi:MAG: hypothetical protein KC442_05410 [Thermomicrobiales bacterium]|nr:hypothetical protein [Thermomicrobiales bacterium]
MRDLPRPTRVVDALANPTHSIEVPDDETADAGPFTERHAEGYRVAEISSFDDLQLLGVIPAGVPEADLMAALREDDRLFASLQRHGAPAASGSAGRCAQDHAVMTPAISRGQFQDHLIEVLQPRFGSGLSATDPAVLHVYRQARTRLARTSRHFIGIYNLVNINVGKNAVLNMAPTVQGVYVADTITIGDNGRLRFRGGSVHVRCTELNGPQETIDPYAIGSPTDLDPWLLRKYVRGWDLESGGN